MCVCVGVGVECTLDLETQCIPLASQNAKSTRKTIAMCKESAHLELNRVAVHRMWPEWMMPFSRSALCIQLFLFCFSFRFRKKKTTLKMIFNRLNCQTSLKIDSTIDRLNGCSTACNSDCPHRRVCFFCQVKMDPIPLITPANSWQGQLCICIRSSPFNCVIIGRANEISDTVCIWSNGAISGKLFETQSQCGNWAVHRKKIALNNFFMTIASENETIA